MRKIGSITPIWNQETFLKPHFDMLSKLDKNVVLLHDKPLPNYHKEHGYSVDPDLSEYLLKKHFPQVEVHRVEIPEGKEFGAWIYNMCLPYVQDMDIVFRLDPDMFFEDAIWDQLLQYIQETNFDAYRMDFANDSINYYMTGDFDHGLKDAHEFDPLAFNPKYELATPITFQHGLRIAAQFQYPHGNDTVIKFPGFLCHHFRGWNKPKSTPNPDWKYGDYARTMLQLCGDNGDWYSCPQSIKEKIEPWLKELKEMKGNTTSHYNIECDKCHTSHSWRYNCDIWTKEAKK